MEIRQLRYFVKSAELLSFTAAAEACFITQGTLSQQLKQLEMELDLPLFDRIGKRIYLTEAGRNFLPYARETIMQSEGGRQAIKDLKDLKGGELRIGVTYALFAVLAPVLIEFSDKYPLINLMVESGTTSALTQQLKMSGLDFLLCFGYADAKESIQGIPLFESKLSLIMSPNYPWSKNKDIDIHQLADLPLILPAKGFHTRSLIDRLFAADGYKPNIKMELNDIHALLDLIKTGKWCTILTSSATANHPGLKAVNFKGKEMARQASVLWMENVYQKKAARLFIDLLADKGFNAI